MSIDIGDIVVVQVDFAIGVTPTDPTVVSLIIKKPDGSTIQYDYPGDPEIVKTATGHYEAEITVDQSQTWAYRWEGDGVATATEEDTFKVERSKVL